MALVDDPDERLRHEPGSCAGCGGDLAGAAEVGVERRQVFDLPPMRVQVTEPSSSPAAAGAELRPAVARRRA